MQVDLKVVQLLCSRLCHDLTGPVGAVHNGMELFDELGPDGGDDALNMVSKSADQLSARLGFFRMAFGLGGLSGRKPALAESRDLAQAFLKGGRITLDWPSQDDGVLGQDLPGPIIKMVLNLVLVAIDALPRGGNVRVALARMEDDQGGPGIGLAVQAMGDGAVLKEGLMTALTNKQTNGEEPDLNAHNVHGFFCLRLAQDLSSNLEISMVENEVRFAVLVRDPIDC